MNKNKHLYIYCKDVFMRIYFHLALSALHAKHRKLNVEQNSKTHFTALIKEG